MIIISLILKITAFRKIQILLCNNRLLDFLGNFPKAESLPIEILSFTAPSQSGGIYLETSAPPTGFTQIIEYSDFAESPSLVKLSPLGSGEITNILGFDDIDVISFEIPAGAEIDAIILTDFIGRAYDESTPLKVATSLKS